ncbi:MAG: LysM peptidoglycan-binding domain-containing protein [Woeseia sp.]|nr:LysM peptidoglycan-binding domain-containing protein [Woeseia sp.]MBT8096534.1 LysM peptidoglycan-binding domain-containing protein [Woeseia sp.]NNE62404.1 LysM peptidoglycan-binding domain-containing protein [Woeseia sp.]NNL55343.1 LysM peptidoglycan-binding domain-containing protein [Woeseia sp.]
MLNKNVLIGLLAVIIGGPLFSQVQTPPDEDLLPVVESYVVKRGDTLAKLARRHLGPDAAWNTNVAVNPDLPEPDKIEPGQVINIITGYERPAPVVPVKKPEVYQAAIEKIYNIVEKNVKSSDWSGAAEGDRLFPLDAVRTLENSSAVLQFDGASTVVITEYSQIFLRALEPQASGISRSEIEISSGETELRLAHIDSPQQQIEINVGGIITRPTRGADGSNSTRTRKVGDDLSQVMVYRGSSAVQSAGVSVDVDTGMGTSAVVGEAPAEPEFLLPAPELQAMSDEVIAENIAFSWQPLDGAASYNLDVCRDRVCMQPILRQRGISEAALILPSLPLGSGYWRVTGVSASGLDGFTSLPSELNIIAVPEESQRNYLHWILIAVALYLLVAVVIAIRDSLSKSAATDDTKTTRM